MWPFHRSVESFLPDRDYLPVAMPTTDLQVLYVLTRQGGVLRRYSTLTTVLDSDAEPATVNRGETVVNAAGNVTRINKVGIGLSVVSAIVKALGGDAGIAGVGVQRQCGRLQLYRRCRRSGRPGDAGQVVGGRRLLPGQPSCC